MPISHISQKTIPKHEVVRGEDIRKEIVELIKKDFPNFDTKDIISTDELNKYRRLYFSQLIFQDKGDLQKIDNEVLKSLEDNSILSENIETKLVTELTTGQKLADRIAEFGGSWTFITIFFSFIMIWMFINIWILSHKAFDPYPFILLNLILSCLAAIQAPIIMMSQNRQEEKDRQRAEQDYKINLKAELEVKLLGEKMDYLLSHQNRKLIEIQELQMDYLEDLFKKLNVNSKNQDSKKTD
jgi:uncharacterized membrane protein